MPNDIAIRVHDLGKMYRIGALQKKGLTLKETMRQMARGPFDYLIRQIRGPEEDEILWALRGITLEVSRGDVLGVIGRNGAGKSTLLKVLSRITEPTEGYAQIHGRLASLLEVGTGFHPELTGRENVLLNGAILGMTRREVERKFDEIVAFAEVEKFIDTPVKRYSSGMYVRLAFAVAAHLEPEILIVDEVLAVGDIAFQRKCLGRMEQVSQEGRTVLFVSHNMAAVRSLCQRGILLVGGRMVDEGPVDAVVARYEQEMFSGVEQADSVLPLTDPESGVSLTGVVVQVLQEGDGHQLAIRVGLDSLQQVSQVGIGIAIHTRDGAQVCRLGPGLTGLRVEELRGQCHCLIHCPGISRHLSEGRYLLTVSLHHPMGGMMLRAEQIAAFDIPGAMHYPNTGRYCQLERHGIVPLVLRMGELERG